VIDAGERRAWGWVAHLRAGGTTPWAAWSGAADPAGWALPGAQQLELLRRLNAAGRPTDLLASRVLEASAPGRGRPDLELVGAAEVHRFGPPPVDPGELPADELIRVATSVLADDVVAAGVPERRVEGSRRPWRTRYRLVGDPWLADPVREALTARGRPPGGRGATVLVLGADLGQMLVDTWTARSFSDGAPGWDEWLGSFVARRQLPPRIDLVRAARHWAGGIGRGRVRIVLDPAALPRLVGVRRGALPSPPVLSADATELARRTGAVLGLLAVPDRRTALLREGLLPRLAADAGPRLAVPARREEWVRRRAERMRETLVADGYPVVGDPDVLLPRPLAGVEGPREDQVLELALRLLLGGGDGNGRAG
jgi:hypothetical protein